jgi:hypothetical protein
LANELAVDGRRDYDGIVNRKMRRILWRLRNERGLSEDEKILWARSLVAAPDERWRLHESHLRSLGLLTLTERGKFGFDSPKSARAKKR